MEFKEGIKYQKEEAGNIYKWWLTHQEYDVNEYEDYIEVAKRPNWEEEQLERLRRERARVCFSVINRGQAWYATLTPEQNEELQAWYRAWLDVTETKVVPETPSWI